MAIIAVLSDKKLSYILQIFLWLPLGLHTVYTKRYDTVTGTGETVPVVSVSLTVKRYLWSLRPDRLFYDIHVANKCGSIPQFYDNNQ